MIKFYCVLFMICLAALPGYYSQAQTPSPYATKLFEYKPAPGQFINDGFGTPADAQGVLGPSNSGMVTLGGFGGYIVVGFDQSIKNDPRNPYGVDFTVIANGFPGWAEPGAVMVMEDVNGNGQPDDTWYELAGSQYYFKGSEQVKMTYTNPRYRTARDVPWETDLKEKGVLRTNIFHVQPYYPQPNIFDNVNADRETYTGRRVNIAVDRANPWYIKSPGLAFGYVDNKLNNFNPTVPLNPYYDDENGSSADGFDISWAVDADGKPVTLSKIDFVKIYNVSQADAGWLGEISTEVECIAITTPNDSWVAQDYWLNVIGAAPLMIPKDQTYSFEGKLFKNGIPQQAGGTWSVSDESIGTMDQQGKFTALQEGPVTIQYQAGDNATPATYNIYVVALKDLAIETNNTSIYVGEQSFLYTESITNRDEPDTHFPYDTYTYTVSDPALASVDANGVVHGKAEGVVTVTATSNSNGDIKESIEITILPAPEFKILKDHFTYEQGTTTIRIDVSTLYSTDGDGQIATMLKSNDNSLLVQAEASDRYLDLTFKAQAAGTANLVLNATVYNTVHEVPLIIQVTPEVTTIKEKRVVFLNGGQFGSKMGNVQIYYPTENKTEKMIDFEKAQSVQDLLVDGRYAYVSAEYDLIKYDIVTKKQVAKRYLEDKSATEADGKGTDGAGLNHSTVFYKDWILVTRQNSYGPPEDGYNVRIYNKSDLSLVKKIPVSTEASGIAIIGDSAFVALNGGFMGASGQLAIIDLVNLEKKEEYNFGADGTSIMQVWPVGKTLYILAQEKMLTYDIKNRSYAKYDIGIGHYDFSSTPLSTAIIDSKLYTKYNWGSYTGENKGFGVIDLQTKTVVTQDLIGMSTDSEIQNAGYMLMGSAYDREDQKFYFTFGQWWGNGIGRIYNKNGSAAGSFTNVEDSPERIAISYDYQNQTPYIAKELASVTVREGRQWEAILNQYFKDDDIGDSLVYTVTAGTPLPTWVTFADQKITATAVGVEPETTVMLTVTAKDASGKTATQQFSITIKPDLAPVVVNPIPAVSVEQGTASQVISLAGVFQDPDDDNDAMTYAVVNNSNQPLVGPSIDGKTLTLNFDPTLFGEASVTIEVTSAGKTARTDVAVTVREKVVTAIEQEPALAALYPNPVTDVVNIRLSQGSKASFSIIRTDGTAVLSGELIAAETAVDMHSLAAGFYVLKIDQGEKIAVYKIIKQ